MIRKPILVYTNRERIIQYSMITTGAVIVALAVVLFLIPYKVAPGGIPGIAVIINTLTKFPPGITMFLLNVPCFIFGIKCLGKEFGLKTIYTAIAISLFTDFFYEILHLSIKIADPILAPIFGGVVLGVGIGLILRGGSSTMGSGTIAKIVSTHTNISNGNIILVLNGIVIITAGFLFNSADLVLYGFIATYVSSAIVDKIVEGFEYVKGAFIISERAIEIADVILYEMQRGATALQGRGLFTHKYRDILFVVVARKEIQELTKIAKTLDPKAFVVITPIHEVLGHGFRKRI